MDFGFDLHERVWNRVWNVPGLCAGSSLFCLHSLSWLYVCPEGTCIYTRAGPLPETPSVYPAHSLMSISISMSQWGVPAAEADSARFGELGRVYQEVF